MSILLNGQNLGFEYGAMWIPQKSTIELHPDIRSTQTSNASQNFFQINYEHQIKKHLYINASYSNNIISTNMNFYRGEHESIGIGWVGTEVSRVDFNAMYNIFYQRKVIIQPYAGFGILRSNPRNYGFAEEFIQRHIQSSQPNIQVIGVDGNAYSKFQIVPVAGIKLGYALWGRIELFINIKGVWGYKTIQDFALSYRYDGIEQPTSRNYADGSGWFLGYGIGYRIVKANKQNKK